MSEPKTIREETVELLQECILQLEYLNEKFGETGTTNKLLSRLNTFANDIQSNKST